LADEVIEDDRGLELSAGRAWNAGHLLDDDLLTGPDEAFDVAVCQRRDCG
jgi:hypothetical protein